MFVMQCVLFFWCNVDMVVIGCVQNLWKECNIWWMEEDNVCLVWCSSGGGVVFYDFGNICFIFMVGKLEYDKIIFMLIVFNVLNVFGVSVEVFGCNDLVVKIVEGDCKVLGLVYCEIKDCGFYYGILLFNVDFSCLVNYFNLDKKKLVVKGIILVCFCVINFIELLLGIIYEQVCEVIIKVFFVYYGECVEVEIIFLDKMLDLLNFVEIFVCQSSWEWNFGQVLVFLYLLDECFSWGGVELYFDVEKGYIICVQVFIDSFNFVLLEVFVG